MAEAVLRGIRIWFIMTTVLSEILKEGGRFFDRADHRVQRRASRSGLDADVAETGSR